MKLVAPVSLVLLSSSIFLFAQNQNQHPAQATKQFANNSCPVSLHVQQSVGGDLLDSKDSRHEGLGQRLHLTATNPDDKLIAKATVTVHGRTSKGHVEQSLSISGVSSDAVKTLDATFSPGSDNAVSAYIWVPGLTAVQAIDLKSITYADGSSWKLSAGEACHFLLDGNMLIAGR